MHDGVDLGVGDDLGVPVAARAVAIRRAGHAGMIDADDTIGARSGAQSVGDPGAERA